MTNSGKNCNKNYNFIQYRYNVKVIPRDIRSQRRSPQTQLWAPVGTVCLGRDKRNFEKYSINERRTLYCSPNSWYRNNLIEYKMKQRAALWASLFIPCLWGGRKEILKIELVESWLQSRPPLSFFVFTIFVSTVYKGYDTRNRVWPVHWVFFFLISQQYGYRHLIKITILE